MQIWVNLQLVVKKTTVKYKSFRFLKDIVKLLDFVDHQNTSKYFYIYQRGKQIPSYFTSFLWRKMQTPNIKKLFSIRIDIDIF